MHQAVIVSSALRWNIMLNYERVGCANTYDVGLGRARLGGAVPAWRFRLAARIVRPLRGRAVRSAIVRHGLSSPANVPNCR